MQSGLEAAVETPKATFDGQDLYPSLFDKAAAYAFHIAESQAFVDGNKRAATLGLDEEDIQAITEFVRWHMNQREKRLAKRRLAELLRKRQMQLRIKRKSELLAELELISQLQT